MNGRALRLLALMHKESLQILRDPSAVLIAFVLPIVLLFLFGFALSLDNDLTPVGVVIEEPSPDGRSLAASFAASRYFSARIGTDRRMFTEDLVAGRLKGIIVIPARFLPSKLGQEQGPRIQVLVDGSDPNTANLIMAYAQGAIANWRSQAGGVSLHQRVWFNQELLSRNFLVPGSIALVMTMVGTLLTALVIAREWERGTMEAIMATPVTGLELLLGKIVPYMVLGLISLTICVLAAVLLFQVPFRGSLPALYLLSAAFLCPALGMGLVISTATKDQFQASQLALLSAFLPAMLLSGFLFEISSMPEPIQWLTLIVPARWFVPGLQSIFLAGDIWPQLLRHIAILLFQGLLLLTLAARLNRKRLA